MVKKIRNTIILSLFMFLIIWCVLIIKTNDVDKELISDMEVVSLNDEDKRNFQNLVNNNELLRKAYLDNENIDNDEMIKFILTGISPDYYITRLGFNNETICTIDNIDFSYETECLFRVISNDTVMEYQKKIFNTQNRLIYNDMEYKNLECKNNGEAYYCLVKTYENNVNNYSVIDNVYVSDDKYVIRDYYVSIDMNNMKECTDYFNYNYCINYPDMEYMNINENMVKSRGALFEYVFTKDNESYYLDEFHILK